MWSRHRHSSFRQSGFERIYQVKSISGRSPSLPVPRWFGRDIWKRYCYKKHTQRRLLCASRPRLTSPCVGKCTLSLTSWAFMVRGASTGYRLLSPPLQKTLTAPQRPGEPHNLSNTRQGGGPNKVWGGGDHPACRATLLFISSSTPNSPENGPFNNSSVEPVLLLLHWYRRMYTIFKQRFTV